MATAAWSPSAPSLVLGFQLLSLLLQRNDLGVVDCLPLAHQGPVGREMGPVALEGSASPISPPHPA